MIPIPVKFAIPDPARDFILHPSVVVPWCFTTLGTQYTVEVLDRLIWVKAFVPDCWPLGLAEAVRPAKHLKLKPASKVDDFLTGLQSLSIYLDDETPVRAWPEILDLARTHSLPVYDAAYLELALRLKLPLATIDPNLTRAAAHVGVSIFTP